MAEITACTCDVSTGCGEYDEAGCPACRASDPYLPCPVFGGMCGMPGDPLCSCCTSEQQAMTRRYYERALSRAAREEVCPDGE